MRINFKKFNCANSLRLIQILEIVEMNLYEFILEWKVFFYFYLSLKVIELFKFFVNIKFKKWNVIELLASVLFVIIYLNTFFLRSVFFFKLIDSIS